MMVRTSHHDCKHRGPEGNEKNENYYFILLPSFEQKQIIFAAVGDQLLASGYKLPNYLLEDVKNLLLAQRLPMVVAAKRRHIGGGTLAGASAA